ncbi:MAG: sigma-70 family RNA polymerase sigma factor [Cytophagales bacterium]|nr:sigma-70 family RNA polymerase sigma factor [Cytophagales bacterium]
MQDAVSSSFEQVIEDNKASIYRICKVYAMSPDQPEDLFQEVVFQVWKSFAGFNGNSNINTWVYRIALNVCLQHKKQTERKQEKTIRLEAIQFQLSERVSDNGLEERQAALYQCLKSLDDLDRTIVIMVLDGNPYKEISAVTQLTENHIAVKMKRIKKTLLTCINLKID